MGNGYVGGQSSGFAGTVSDQTITFALTGGLDSVPSAGDLVIVTYGVVNQTGDTTLSIKNTGATAYTLFGTEGYGAWALDSHRRTAYRVMPGTPETQVVLGETVSGGTGAVTDPGMYTIHVYRGVHATPLEQAVQQGTGTSTSIIDPGSITPATTGTWVYVAGVGATGTGAVYTSSDLAAFLSHRTDETGQDGVIGAGHFEWTSGTFSPATFGGGGTDTTNNSYTWCIVALAPAASLSNKLVGLLGQPLARH